MSVTRCPVTLSGSRACGNQGQPYVDRRDRSSSTGRHGPATHRTSLPLQLRSEAAARNSTGACASKGAWACYCWDHRPGKSGRRCGRARGFELVADDRVDIVDGIAAARRLPGCWPRYLPPALRHRGTARTGSIWPPRQFTASTALRLMLERHAALDLLLVGSTLVAALGTERRGAGARRCGRLRCRPGRGGLRGDERRPARRTPARGPGDRLVGWRQALVLGTRWRIWVSRRSTIRRWRCWPRWSAAPGASWPTAGRPHPASMDEGAGDAGGVAHQPHAALERLLCLRR